MREALERRIRERAYSLWEAEGRPEGRANDYWYRAVKIELGWRFIGYQASRFLKEHSFTWALLYSGLGCLIGIAYASWHTISGELRWLSLGLVTSLMVCVLVVIIPRIQAHRYRDGDPEKWVWAVNEYRKTLASLVAGLLIIVGFFFTAKQITGAFQKDLGDRFVKAVEEIGSTAIDIRVGGVYGLARMFRDSPDDKPAVLEILSTFVKRRASTDPSSARTGALPADVVAALLTLSDALGDSVRLPNRGRTLDLGGVDLGDASLPNLNLSNVSLIKARFTNADLSGVVLHNANLEFATFDGAVLRRADLRGTDILGASFRQADLSDADLTSVRNATAMQLRQAILARTKLPADLAAELKDAQH